MPNGLDELGKILMERVRDEAIGHWDSILSGKMKDEESQAIHQQVRKMGPQIEALVRALVPRIVDTTLHHLLWTLEQNQERLKLIFVGEEGETDAAADSDGLPGELYTEEGWIARFSKGPKSPL
jgi:hypothetical protein